MTRMMKHNIKLLLLVVLLLTVSFGNVLAESFVVGELVCQMAEGESIDIVNSQFSTVTAQELPILNVYQLDFTGGQDLETLSASIELLPEVVFCHPNYLIDPLQTVQGSLPISDIATREEYLSQPATTQVNLGAIQAITTGSGAIVGVLDGGAYLQHPEFSGTLVSGFDYVDNDPIANDEAGGLNTGHGTFIAGVIKLLAPDVQIRVYRVTDVNGESNGYIVAEAIMQAVEENCNVINLSMVTVEEHKAISEALQYAWDNNVLVVAAAGNGYSSEAHYPASDINVVGVAAVNSLNDLADFSSFGDHVDVCAPGVEICSPFVDDKYAWWEGTSFAAPFVTAQAALLFSFFNGVPVSDIKDAIINTADNIDDNNPGKEGMLGAGMINPLASLSTICGDVDGDEIVGLQDITALMNYVYNGNDESYNLSVSDVDNWEGIHASDIQALCDKKYGSNLPLDCSPENVGPFPVSNDYSIEFRNYTIPPHQSTWVVEWVMIADAEFSAFAFPLSISLSGAPYIKDSVVIDTNFFDYGLPARFEYRNPGWSQEYDFVAMNMIFGSIPAGEYSLAKMYLSHVYSNNTQVVILDTINTVPRASTFVSTQNGRTPVIPQITGFVGTIDQDSDGIYDQDDNCPAVANSDQNDRDDDSVGDVCDNCAFVYNPDQEDSDGNGRGDVCPSCCGAYTFGVTGNTNCDTGGLRDLADVTRLIDNVYITKVELCCVENGNVNGDTGSLINLADITRLIDHVYITKAATANCE